jgi:soluble lytic murein transglycosylase-like protein
LSLGTSAVRQQGSPGKRIITYWIKKSKSGKVSRKKIQSVLVAPPVKEIIVRGTAVVGPGEVTSKITYWANKYGVSSSWMLQIAKCESNFNPGSVNPYGYKGLYQYGASQWSTDTSGAGISGASIWDPNAQAHAAAWHISHYGAGAWSCA